jgi:hypothetical protein
MIEPAAEERPSTIGDRRRRLVDGTPVPGDHFWTGLGSTAASLDVTGLPGA